MCVKESKEVVGVGVISLYPDNVIEGYWIIEHPKDAVAFESYALAKEAYDSIQDVISFKKVLQD